jgi:hypothetical protein
VLKQSVNVTCHGRQYGIPFLAASAWINALTSQQSALAVFPGMLPQAEYTRVLDGLMDGSINEAEVRNAALHAIRQAAGRPWWEAVRLVGMADAAGATLVGMLTLAGVDSDVMPFGRWLAAVYALGVKGKDEKERMIFEAKLSVPPAGIDPDVLAEEGQDDFAAMVNLARSAPGMSTGGQ